MSRCPKCKLRGCTSAEHRIEVLDSFGYEPASVDELRRDQPDPTRASVDPMVFLIRATVMLLGDGDYETAAMVAGDVRDYAELSARIG